jgi:DNA-binding Lrp family transcriptional regulator
VVDAFILVQVQLGRAASVLEGLRSLEGVIDAELVTGPYDVIALVRVPNLHDLGVFAELLNRLDGVLRALASPVVSSDGAVQ